MKRIWWALLFLMGIETVAAQDGACLEVWNYWSDHVRHTVNLDSGTVVSRAAPETTTAYRGETSPDGHYNARMEAHPAGSVHYRLLLTDPERGISITLANSVSGLEWSPDGVWLAYMQARPDRTLAGLALYNMASGERVSGSLPENEWDMLGIGWSPDGSRVAVTFVMDSVFLGSDVVLFLVPDLTLTQTFRTRVISASIRWSPDGRSIAAVGTNDVLALIDVPYGQVEHVGLDGSGYYEVYWSPGGSFVLVKHTFGDLAEMMDIYDAQGHVLVRNRWITYHDWVNDRQALVRTWETSGLNNLMLFDLASGQQRVIQARVGLHAVSPDGRHVAVTNSQTIRVFDLMRPPLPANPLPPAPSRENVSLNVPARTIDTLEAVHNLIWREDGQGLLALFFDDSLREFDFENGAWRTIAAVPGDEWMLRWVECGAA